MRANPILQHVKVILCSNLVNTKARLQGYEAGADDYLAKPFEKAELLAKLSVFLRLKSLVREK